MPTIVADKAQQDSAERALNKLTRTYAMHLEAFKRYRIGGEQKVTVQHVLVNEGGKAIVGNVTQGAPATAPQKPANVTPALADARKPAMTIIGVIARGDVAVISTALRSLLRFLRRPAIAGRRRIGPTGGPPFNLTRSWREIVWGWPSEGQPQCFVPIFCSV
jgi:hypothetical protein